jgi:hypothetical protein
MNELDLFAAVIASPNRGSGLPCWSVNARAGPTCETALTTS